jgi:hypothetical protein
MLCPLDVLTPLLPPVPTLEVLEFVTLADCEDPLEELLPQLEPWLAPSDVPVEEPLEVLPPTNPSTPPFIPLIELSD